MSDLSPKIMEDVSQINENSRRCSGQLGLESTIRDVSRVEFRTNNKDLRTYTAAASIVESIEPAGAST